MHGGEHILIERGGVEVILSWTFRTSDAAEVDSEDAEPLGGESEGLGAPALFVESAAVGEHDGVRAGTVEVGADEAAVIGGKGDGLLCWGDDGSSQREGKKAQGQHAEIIGLRLVAVGAADGVVVEWQVEIGCGGIVLWGAKKKRKQVCQ